MGYKNSSACRGHRGEKTLQIPSQRTLHIKGFCMSDKICYVHSFSASLFAQKQCASTFESSRFRARGVHLHVPWMWSISPTESQNQMWTGDPNKLKINKRGTDITLDTFLRYVSSISPRSQSTDRFYGPWQFHSKFTIQNCHFQSPHFTTAKENALHIVALCNL